MSDRLKKLEDLVVTLRGPDGCPWDRAQKLPDIRAYLLEEAHELAAAIDACSPAEIREEMGDLLFHLVFISNLLQESDESELGKVVDGIHRKMVDRHPHVFGGATLPDGDAVHRAWEERKTDQGRSALGGVPDTLPALLSAYRVSQKAAGVGFDWPDVGAVFDKVTEELEEVQAALEEHGPGERVEEEVGDLLFAVANLARKAGFDPEAALQKANRKFRGRFEAMERLLDDQTRLSEQTDDQLEDLWRRAKEADTSTPLSER